MSPTTLTTDRGFVARRWDTSDASAVIAAFADAEMATQRSGPIDDLVAAGRWLDERIDQWESGRAYSWAIEDGGVLLGSVTLSDVDRRHGTAWVSYWTTAGARGRGVATSALRAVALWAFDVEGLFRLELGHRVNNPASCRVATAAGFAVEGVERQKLRYGDERFDVELHARLATDPAPL